MEAVKSLFFVIHILYHYFYVYCSLFHKRKVKKKMFLTIAKGEKPQNSVFVSSLPHTSLFFSILKRLTTEELFMNVSSEEKKRIKRGIILMKYAAVHV